MFENLERLAPEEILQKLLQETIARKASDLHLSAEHHPHFRQQGVVAAATEWPVLTANVVRSLAQLLSQQTRLGDAPEIGALDGSLSSESGGRFRFNIYRRGGSFSIAIRRLEDRIRSLVELGLPSELYSLCDHSHGLVLVAGPTGSGKSTTLATLIDRINRTRPCHIITIEDPVEYLHTSDVALVDQREVGHDTESFNDALVASMRQDPDVILVGEIRDLNTIRTAITAAETGHLVFATVHSGDCISSIDRLVSVFHVDEQPGIRRQLAMVLRAVVAQRLIIADGSGVQSRDQELSDESKEVGKGRLVLASEAMMVTNPVANLISLGKDAHIQSVIETGSNQGMYAFDECLALLLREGQISERTAKGLAKNPHVMMSQASRLRPSRVKININGGGTT